MKTLSVALLIALTPTIVSASDTKVPCKLEGERFYAVNQLDTSMDDVYVCENGAWQFLFTNPHSPLEDL